MTPTILTIPRDVLQVVFQGRVTHEVTQPLFVWMKSKPWVGTRVHLLGVHGRSDCGHVDLRAEATLKRFKVSRRMPDFMLCRHCNWYGQHRAYGA